MHTSAEQSSYGRPEDTRNMAKKRKSPSASGITRPRPEKEEEPKCLRNHHAGPKT